MRRPIYPLALLLTLGCASYRSGPQATGHLIQSNPAYTLGIVELDDQGWFTNRADVDRVLKKVEEEAKGNGASIVVFVHGWHHNAAPRDTNLRDFQDEVLKPLHERLRRPLYRSSRDLIIPGAKNRVIGIYVGWRGASLPGLLDYATFWDRHPAAARVGHGDVIELFTRLARIQDKYNRGKEFTTLVTVGHSFGAQVVFAAISNVLKSRIVGRTPDTPTLSGVGDLVVLVNPAQEASIYNSIHLLTRDAFFSPEQAPILLTVSSQSDFPNRVLFPIGRTLATKNEPHGRGDQFRQKTHSLGHVKSHITHCLFLTGKTPCKGYPPSPIPPPPPITDDTELTPALLAAIAAKPAQLAEPRSFGSTAFYPVGSIDPNNPFLVAKTTADVVPGHNGMFNEPLLDFVSDFIALAQLKRLVRPETRPYAP